jgi:hypothetical protein
MKEACDMIPNIQNYNVDISYMPLPSVEKEVDAANELARSAYTARRTLRDIVSSLNAILYEDWE